MYAFVQLGIEVISKAFTFLLLIEASLAVDALLSENLKLMIRTDFGDTGLIVG
jgi:hypothetical protein